MMKASSKRITSLILALILTFSIFAWTDGRKVNAAEPIKIGYRTSNSVIKKGDTVEVYVFFKNFQEIDIECTAFQFDLIINTEIFSVESKKCNFDGTGAMMNTTKYNETSGKLTTVYFYPAKALPKNSVGITTFTLKLKKDIEKYENVELSVATAIALDADNNRFVLEYDTPVITCGVSSELPSPSNDVPSATQFPTQTQTDSPTEEPSSTPNLTLYTVTYKDFNGRILWSEKVQEGHAASNLKIPNRPGYIFKNWEIDKGDLKAVDCNITATAAYIPSDTKCNITVKNGSFLGLDNGGSDKVANLQRSFNYNDCVIVQVDESLAAENTYFLGWTKSDDNKIVSYSKTYSFLVRESCTVRAVFSTEKIMPTPTIVMFEHSFYMSAGVFSCERYIPSGCAYSGSGIIITKDESVGVDDNKFILNTEGTSVYGSQDSAVNAQFSVVHTNYTEKMYARAYLIYKNENNEQAIVYSDIVEYDPNLLF